MGVDTHAPAFPPVMVVSSGRHRGATGARLLGPATPARRDRRITFAGAIVTLGASILVALAVPLTVVALPVVLLARLVRSIVWARSR